MELKKNITRQDIAREAQVSVSVVSRALNNSGYVEKKKRKQILEIADRLGYTANPVAMALQQKQTHQLLCICNELILSGTFYSQIFNGMVREAENHGYHVLAAMGIEDMSRVKKLMVDGILFPMETFAQEYANKVGKNYHLPTVTASFDSDVKFALPMPMVSLDNDKIINDTIDYLWKMGHRKIGMVWHELNLYSKRRYEFWKRRMLLEIGEEALQFSIPVKKWESSECFIADPRHYSLKDCNNYIFAGHEAAREYGRMRHKPTAVICFNDDMAIGMMMELGKIGVHVPDELSVIGIDAIQRREIYYPRLTSMNTNPEKQGGMCVTTLISMLEGKDYKYTVYIPHELAEGESVKQI